MRPAAGGRNPLGLGRHPGSLALFPLAAYDLFKQNWQRAYPLALAASWMLALAAALFYLPIHSKELDASPFTRRIGPRTEAAPALYALNLSNTQGFIPFYLHKPVKDLGAEKDLAQLARSSSPIYVVVIGQEPKVLKTSPGYVEKRGARLELLYQEPIGERLNALWRLVPTKPRND